MSVMRKWEGWAKVLWCGGRGFGRFLRFWGHLKFQSSSINIFWSCDDFLSTLCPYTLKLFRRSCNLIAGNWSEIRYWDVECCVLRLCWWFKLEWAAFVLVLGRFDWTTTSNFFPTSFLHLQELSSWNFQLVRCSPNFHWNFVQAINFKSS